MSGIAVGKRRFHAFLSHSHIDSEHADRLVSWLRDVVGAPVWYDADHLSPGATIAQALPDAIEQSRSVILLLSRHSVARGWVQQEFHAAINHQTEHRAFRIIPVRLDDVEPPGFLQNYSNISVGQDGLDTAGAAGILKGLYQPTAPPMDPEGGRNVYFSKGWRPDDHPMAHGVGIALAKAGLQLIGESEDQQSWVESRIIDIMDSCGAFAAVLPFRDREPHLTSKYVLREWEIAATRGLPCLVVADPRVDLSAELLDRQGLTLLDDQQRGLNSTATDAALALAEDWITPVRSPYVFYATDFAAESQSRRRVVKELVEAVTTRPCVLAEYVAKGDVVQREILHRVSGASLVLADLSGDSPNVYVEIGAARAANVPLALLRQGPQGRPAFMLRDQQVWDYAADADLLGRVVRVTYPYRRTLLTPSSP